MACGLATLQVLEEEGLVERSRVLGAELRRRLEELQSRYSVIKEVRGLGLMLAIEFHEPRELAARMGWKLLQSVEPGLFAQMVVTSLCTKHRILTQLAGHSMNVLKVLPPLIIGEAEIVRFVGALEAVLDECRRFPGPIWEFGANLVRHSLRRTPVETVSAR
jgi:4-aminobutyrate aminotransferase-like enzyme